METTDPIAELNVVFENLRGMIGKLAIAEDADHRAAGKSKKALEFCETKLRDLSLDVDGFSERVRIVLDRITKELAAITSGTAVLPVKAGKIADCGIASTAITDNIPPGNAHTGTNGTDWVTKVKKGKKTTSTVPKSPSSESSIPARMTKSEVQYDEVQVVPGYRRKCIMITRREEALNHLGRFCVIISSGLVVVGVEDYILPLWIPELQNDSRWPRKVIDHNDPKSVVDPTRNDFFIDPVQNSASVDTGNFLTQTHIRPISYAKVGGTQYCVRVGGSETIVADLAQCSASQLAFARRYFLSGLMRAIMIIDTERKIQK